MQLARSMRRSFVPLTFLALPAATQSVVHYVPSGGTSVLRAGDFDQDGLGDFAIRLWDQVSVHSGVDASLILHLPFGGGNGTLCTQDLDHDGTPDVVLGDVGAPDPSGVGTGSATAYSGATGAVLWRAFGAAQSDAFGFVLGDAGDANADGTPDVLVEAWQYNPPMGGGPGYVRLLSGVDGGVLHEWAGVPPGYASFGVALGTLGDYDGDGHDDALVTDLTFNGGEVRLYSGATGVQLKVFDLPGGGGFGMSLDATRDIDGDGVRDMAATAPAWGDWSGRVVAVSGADGTVLVDVLGTQPYGTYLGGDVDVIDDLNGDGVPDLLTCGHDLDALTGESGFALIVSGADGSTLLAMPTQALGLGVSNSPTAALGDLDGDGLPEFAVTGGSTIVYSTQSDPPVAYCPAKVNSQGCTPVASWSGTASLTGPADFQLSCTGMLNRMRGALMWSPAASSPPYQGGSLCLAAPWQPATAFATGGTPTGVDCSGLANLPLSQAFLAGTGATPGTTLYVQFFYRDPFQPDGSGLGLSDGVSFSLLP